VTSCFLFIPFCIFFFFPSSFSSVMLLESQVMPGEMGTQGIAGSGRNCTIEKETDGRMKDPTALWKEPTFLIWLAMATPAAKSSCGRVYKPILR
jgi:hypothetical protein